MGKLHRLFGVAAASAVMVGTMGAAPAVAVPEGPVTVQGMCPGDPLDLRARALNETVAIKETYYSSSATLKSVPRGTTMAIYGLHTNKYDNLWIKVQYSDRTNDWCGWVYDGWIETYY
ncbi:MULTISPECIES: hypothetical protein [Streptomyces]|uniref:SH3 domain-containing protein n=1 Tax=Streptomyces lycii TaxID=2654337 RepID=A0ABQ7FIE7_9ACTN|nr:MULTISPECIES: hypothetical protein [Streptomyces]KAF4407728.1 hypothetical protein GCU69_18200 [Streptomyces lycii]PGH51526.1 hypothetical protein CRI70_06145 [Streptomyces sp. Ru87]